MSHLLPSSRARVSSASFRPRICPTCIHQLSRVSVRHASDSAAIPSGPLENTSLYDKLSRTFSKVDTTAALPRAEDLGSARPAISTWDNLQWVGSRKFIWENTQVTNQVKRWAPDQPIPLDRLESQMFCALIDTLFVYNGRQSSARRLRQFPTFSEQEWDECFPHGVSITCDAQGRPSLNLSDSEIGRIWNNISLNYPSSEVEWRSKQSSVSIDSSKSRPADSLQSVPLQPLSLRFAFLKRLLQRTGHRITDSNLARCTTVGAVHAILTAQLAEKRKLAQVLEQDTRPETLKDRANVAVKSTRYTKLDRDQSLGRWKLAREALAKAGLPEFWTDAPLSRRRRNTAMLR